MPLETESLISIQKALDYHEKRTGKRPAPSTMHRHRKKGTCGIRLETLVILGEIYTSHEAIHRFWNACAKAKDAARNKLRKNGIRVNNFRNRAAENKEADQLGL